METKGKKMRNARSGNRGFTLIEVMIAVMILSITLVSVGYMMARSDRDMEHAQDWTAAHRAAQTVLETLRSQDMDTMRLQDGATFQVLSTSQQMTGNIDIEELDWESADDISYQITVSVPEMDVRLSTVRTIY